MPPLHLSPVTLLSLFNFHVFMLTFPLSPSLVAFSHSPPPPTVSSRYLTPSLLSPPPTHTHRGEAHQHPILLPILLGTVFDDVRSRHGVGQWLLPDREGRSKFFPCVVANASHCHVYCAHRVPLPLPGTRARINSIEDIYKGRALSGIRTVKGEQVPQVS